MATLIYHAYEFSSIFSPQLWYFMSSAQGPNMAKSDPVRIYSLSKQDKQAGAELSQAQPKLGLLFCPSWDYGWAQAGTMV